MGSGGAGRLARSRASAAALTLVLCRVSTTRLAWFTQPVPFGCVVVWIPSLVFDMVVPPIYRKRVRPRPSWSRVLQPAHSDSSAAAGWQGWPVRQDCQLEAA